MKMIVADWGTTNLRVYACDDGGTILDRVESRQGIKSLGKGDYPAALSRATAQLKEHHRAPVFVCGMAGSRNGWIETPYCQAPLDLEALASRLVPLPGPLGGYLLPGARTLLPDGTSDVMRGEEIQIFGAVSRLDLRSGVLCLPGTHSKWVRLREGRIIDFATFMTGDIFQALSQTILACDAAAPHHMDAFAQGLQAARAGDFGLLHRLFTARTRVLDGALDAAHVSAYVSGLLIGHELAEAEAWRVPGETVTIIGSESLCRRYSEALSLLGEQGLALDSSVATCSGVAALRHLLSGGA
jgi:2-dehydro-3-deoxygalactonokinase